MTKYFGVALMIAACVAGQAELRNTRTYGEMCDASAAVALDENHFAVADDEGNTLRVYKRAEDLPTREFEIAKFLGNSKKTESDLEGAARVGNRVYWIGSHGRGRDGKEEPHRQRFFATDIKGEKGRKLEPVGKPYTTLLKDLFADPRFKNSALQKSSLLSPKHQGGLNIEGMCGRASDGAVLIAFRTPVPDGKALILPLLNPDKVIRGEHARFGDLITLDLGGYGIRDLAPDENGFLILASATHGPHIFKLYYWDGKSGDPQVVSDERFEGWNPEALFRFPSDPPGVFQILSDDGRHMGGGIPCKDFPKEQRRFRAGELHVDSLKR